MPTLAEVKQQIAAYPHRYVFWTQKEIRALPEILDSNERILAVTSGMRNSATWLLVCTNRRLIFLNRGMIFGLRQVQMPLDRIQSIDHSSIIVFGTISVWDGASSVGINMVLSSSILPFVRVTEEAMYRLRKNQEDKELAVPPTQAASSSPPATDVASQLERLAALKEKGHLTEAEFQAQKKKLLS